MQIKLDNGLGFDTKFLTDDGTDITTDLAIEAATIKISYEGNVKVFLTCYVKKINLSNIEIVKITDSVKDYSIKTEQNEELFNFIKKRLFYSSKRAHDSTENDFHVGYNKACKDILKKYNMDEQWKHF